MSPVLLPAELSDPVIDAIAFVLFARGWEDDSEGLEDFSDEALRQMRANWEGVKAEVAENPEHHGDCTNVARSCMACMLEDLVRKAKRLRV